MTTETRPGKVRHCWICGESMGFVENRFYDSRDTCGKIECDREARDAYAAEREAAHREVDNYFDNGW